MGKRPEDKNKNEGWYYGDYPEKDLPLNQQNALGRTLATLWLATGKEQYRARAEKLANFFKNCLRRVDNRYVWSYWPNGGRYLTRGDLSYSLQMGRWGHLGFIDREIRSILHGYFKLNWKKNTATGMTSAAYLVETQARFRIDDVLRKH